MRMRGNTKRLAVKYLFPLEIGGSEKEKKVVKSETISMPKYFDALLSDDATPEEIESYKGLIEYKDRKKK